jgi:hypothetical protein
VAWRDAVDEHGTRETDEIKGFTTKKRAVLTHAENLRQLKLKVRLLRHRC